VVARQGECASARQIEQIRSAAAGGKSKERRGGKPRAKGKKGEKSYVVLEGLPGIGTEAEMLVD